MRVWRALRRVWYLLRAYCVSRLADVCEQDSWRHQLEGRPFHRARARKRMKHYQARAAALEKEANRGR